MWAGPDHPRNIAWPAQVRIGCDVDSYYAVDYKTGDAHHGKNKVLSV